LLYFRQGQIIKNLRGSIIKQKKARSRKQLAWIVLAVIFLIGFVAGLGFRIYGSTQTANYLGPDHLAVGNGKVYLSVSGDMFVLTDIGDTLLQLTSRQLDLKGSITDLEMMPDGRLLIAERRPARIRLCSTDTWQCQEVKFPKPLERTLENHFKVLPDPDGNTLYVSDDSRKGPLYKIGIAEGQIKPVLKGVLRNAGDLKWGPDGLMWVADSGHQRIVQLKLTDKGPGLTGFPFSAKNRASFENRTWPVVLQMLPGGEWAVTQTSEHGGQADILIYKDAQTPERRLALDDSVDPTDLAVANGWLVASDYKDYRLFSIDTDSGAAQNWGDAKITNWLANQKREHIKFERWVDGGLVVMVLTAPFMLLAGYFGTPKSDREKLAQAGRIVRLQPSDKEVPPLSSIYWLKRRHKTELFLRFLGPLYVTVMVLILSALGYALYQLSGNVSPDKQSKLIYLFLILLAATVGSLPVVFLNLRIVRGQLGTDGQRIFVRYPGGTQASAPANKIVYAANMLRFGRNTVSVGARQRQALYEPGELETYISPLLRHGKKVGVFGLAWRQIVGGEPGPIYTYIYFIALIGLAIYVKIFA